MTYRVIEYWNGGRNGRAIGGKIETLEDAIKIAQSSKLYGEGKRTFGEEGVEIRNNSCHKVIKSF